MTLFSSDFLKKLADGELTGSFEPFISGTPGEVEAYIRCLIGRISDVPGFHNQPDFDHYGSGYASYVPVRLWKADGSDIIEDQTREGIRRTFTGVELYISRLAPFWYYGRAEWTANYDKAGRNTGGSSEFLYPESIEEVNLNLWQDHLAEITRIMEEYGYQLLFREEMERVLDFEVQIHSIFADKPYKVFDCFFYWED